MARDQVVDCNASTRHPCTLELGECQSWLLLDSANSYCRCGIYCPASLSQTCKNGLINPKAQTRSLTGSGIHNDCRLLNILPTPIATDGAALSKQELRYIEISVLQHL
ncbi:hypothetical protein BJX61DRAFT_508002 [Aspergillus egyptiacus]|nr:hypothetical protein BJX61DRAFT_508002 [Aspergillus egyptiacus]